MPDATTWPFCTVAASAPTGCANPNEGRPSGSPDPVDAAQLERSEPPWCGPVADW